MTDVTDKTARTAMTAVARALADSGGTEAAIPAAICPPVPAPVTHGASTERRDGYDSEGAFERALPRILAVAPESLLPLNRDAVTVVTVVLRALPALLSWLPALHETYVSFDETRLTALGDAANALYFAHHALASAIERTDEAASIFPRCVRLRDAMRYDLRGLIRRGIVKRDALSPARGRAGYAAVASDLSRMGAIYRAGGSAFQPYSGMPPREIDEALALADKLRFLVAHRDEAKAEQLERALRRQKAYTLVLRDYTYVRRLLDVVFFVRGLGSVDVIAPSVHSTRGPTAAATRKRHPALAPKARPDDADHRPRSPEDDSFGG